MSSHHALTRRIDDGVVPLLGEKFLRRARDGDTTLTLLLLAVHVEGEREGRLAEAIGLSLQLLHLTLGNTAELEKKAAGGRRLACESEANVFEKPLNKGLARLHEVASQNLWMAVRRHLAAAACEPKRGSCQLNNNSCAPESTWPQMTTDMWSFSGAAMLMCVSELVLRAHGVTT